MEAAFQQGFASALLDVLFKRVAEIIEIEYKKIKNENETLLRMRTTIMDASKLLGDVDPYLCRGSNQNALQEQIYKLTNLCYDAQDLMDDLALQITENHPGSVSRPIHSLILSSLRNLGKPHAIDKLLKHLESSLTELQRLVELATKSDARKGGSNGYYLPKLEMPLIGRDNELKEIIENFTSGPLNGVCIVGADGLGKTALAQSILKDPVIIQHFPLRSWLFMPDGSFNLSKAVDKLIGDGILFEEARAQILGVEPCSNSQVRKEPDESLLITFDNLLRVNPTDWDVFWSHLISSNTGQARERSKNVKILVTTLDPGISMLIGTESHCLKPLSKENCRDVISKKALIDNGNLPESKLSHVAGDLANKCEGLPLVARMLGFHLARCKEDDWHILLSKNLWDMDVYQDDILPIIKMSYLNMSPCLKKRLAYFSLFPEDCSFNIDLVHLWMGEGFIDQHDREGRSTLEETCNHCLDALLERSFIQRLDNVSHTEKPPLYQLQKFSHKFAQLAASRTCLRLDEGMSTSDPFDINTRHISLSCHNLDSELKAKISKLKGLRTFLAHCNGQIHKIPPDLFKGLSYLRVLSLKRTNVTNLPDSIDRLKRLRFLDISCTPIIKLPKTLSKLRTLKFLKLRDTLKLVQLPKGLENLTNLLYLDWEQSDIRRHGLPSKIGGLTSLPLFPVGVEEGHSITELRNMDLLEGSICCTNLENVNNEEEAEAAKLCDKIYLKRIELQWSTPRKSMIAKDILTSLKPHGLLKELKITNYGADVFPEWVSHPSFMLNKIHIHGCKFCNVLPALGQLPHLKSLVLEQMSNLIVVDRHSSVSVGHFPSLESLKFKDLRQLEEWTGLEEHDMPFLRSLKIIDCPQLVELPSLNHLTSLVDLQIRRCQKLQSLPILPTSLQELTISECNLLNDRCRVGGEDWSKINCVRKVEIDGQMIPTLPPPFLPTSSNEQQQNIFGQAYRLIKNTTETIFSVTLRKKQS